MNKVQFAKAVNKFKHMHNVEFIIHEANSQYNICNATLIINNNSVKCGNTRYHEINLYGGTKLDINDSMYESLKVVEEFWEFKSQSEERYNDKVKDGRSDFYTMYDFFTWQLETERKILDKNPTAEELMELDLF